MLKYVFTKKFKRELKKQEKRGKDVNKFFNIAKELAMGEKLHEKHCNHVLKGNFKNLEECHIEPNWLLLYCKTREYIIFERTGTHSDIFKN